MAALQKVEDPNTPGEMRKRLNIIADNLVRSAMAGDMQAIAEVGNRIDGKPKQMIEGAGDSGEHLARLIVENVIVHRAAED
jgi:hypothetical protein